MPDAEEPVAYENQEEEPVAMIEESPLGVAIICRSNIFITSWTVRSMFGKHCLLYLLFVQSGNFCMFSTHN